MTKSVLIVASHPDDEILGVGGTIARHAAAGDDVNILIVAEGATSRRTNFADEDPSALKTAAQNAAAELGARKPRLLGLPDNRLDDLALLEITQRIETVVTELSPEIVYTHFAGDLNRDHAITAEATEIACRPLPGSSVKSIYAFETLSSTEWGISDGATGNFTPNRFVGIDDFLADKLAALRHYEVEMRPFPHPRSYEAVEALARLRGAQAGLTAAEAFMVRREIRQ